MSPEQNKDISRRTVDIRTAGLQYQGQPEAEKNPSQINEEFFNNSGISSTYNKLKYTAECRYIAHPNLVVGIIPDYENKTEMLSLRWQRPSYIEGQPTRSLTIMASIYEENNIEKIHLLSINTDENGTKKKNKFDFDPSNQKEKNEMIKTINYLCSKELKRPTKY